MHNFKCKITFKSQGVMGEGGHPARDLKVKVEFKQGMRGGGHAFNLKSQVGFEQGASPQLDVQMFKFSSRWGEGSTSTIASATIQTMIRGGVERERAATSGGPSSLTHFVNVHHVVSLKKVLAIAQAIATCAGRMYEH